MLHRLQIPRSFTNILHQEARNLVHQTSSTKSSTSQQPPVNRLANSTSPKMVMAIDDSTTLPQAHQRMKRPPPPSVQTSLNGTKSSHSSPSPSLSSKRPPPGVKQPLATASTNGTIVNGTGPRLSGRQRRESQRPGDVHARQGRNNGRTGSIDGQIVDRKSVKRLPEPLGKSLSILY